MTSSTHFIAITIGSFLVIVFRYFLIAGAAYWWVYRRGQNRFSSRKIQNKLPSRRVIQREILWSIATSFIFALAGAVTWQAWQAGQTPIYLSVTDYGWIYLIFSFGLLAFLHDTYFYWIHRLMHHPALFKKVHRIHHDSIQPTPWAAFSFHPLEAVLEALILPALIFIVPVHPGTFLALLMTMTVLSVINHLGYEFYPRGFAKHFLGKWIISATHHDLHHSQYRYNYGLYFTWWDRWMGTQRP